MVKIFVNAFICSLLFLVSCGDSKKESSSYALTVNGHHISITEFDKTVEYIKQSMIQMAPQSALESASPEMRKNAARQLIANDLMVDEAKRRGLKYDSVAVEAVFTKFQSQFGSRETFIEEIKKGGETEIGIRKQMQDGALIDTLLKIVFAAHSDPDSIAIRSYYDENKSKFTRGAKVRVSQIFFPFDSTASTDEGKQKILAKANVALTEIKAGKDFAKLANKNSSGAAATDGGDIGWFGPADLKPELWDPISKIDVGQVSEVVTSEKGYHLFKKTASDTNSTVPFADVKDQIAMMLNMKTKNDVVNSLVDSLMQNAKITYHDTSLVPGPKKDIPLM
ncbi:MAG TPA: peptidyl-prolyl cis-trans isomerase [Chitinispirillaceae bacterium]|nr:peptidyl-prolyl cis-trans isomerase [Chitinispirillaceae bacterium]